MRFMFRGLGDGIFGVYATSVFAAVSLSTLAAVAVTPAIAGRRQLVRHAAGSLLSLTGTRLSVSGLDHVPEDPCIVIANHSSYLDGPILSAVLPPRFGFVIMREMTRVPFAHFLLRRIGSEFVERKDTHKGAADARRILHKAGRQESLAFFPEGSILDQPGLRRFHNGAFAAAVRGKLPVVPVVIRGSRDMLPAARRLPRPGRIEVIIKPALRASGDDAVHVLREQARLSILEDLNEPDLLQPELT
ncbi:MAG: 1-acyl-sn-glycerol-3-phosphate acyltransferase [Gammaproteobacteria bacterium]|nr:1-acyl-sn-glycerol-3-phosphate acyltransferase [Gammaproteobacteria bacterium]